MLSYLGVQAIEIIVGIVVAVILVGGFAAYTGYKVWAKKHGKSCCDGNCAHCSGCHINQPSVGGENKPSDESNKNDADEL